MALALLALIGAPGCVKVWATPLLLPEAELTPTEAIVVLGYGPPVDARGAPVPELARRVGKGVELYQQGLAPLMIMTGGNTYQDYYESAVMKELAVKLGVPAEAVLEEREAKDTIGNARRTARLMAERGLSRCVLVSSPYHLKRGKKLFEAAGLEVQTAAAAPSEKTGERLLAVLHEYLVAFNYLFIDEAKLVREDESPKSIE